MKNFIHKPLCDYPRRVRRLWVVLLSPVILLVVVFACAYNATISVLNTIFETLWHLDDLWRKE